MVGTARLLVVQRRGADCAPTPDRSIRSVHGPGESMQRRNSTVHNGGNGSRSGFTLLEVTVSMAVVSVAFLALARDRAQRAGSSHGARGDGGPAGRRARRADEVEGTPFDQLWRRYNDDPADDPAEGGQAPGSTRSVEGLSVAGESLPSPRGSSRPGRSPCGSRGGRWDRCRAHGALSGRASRMSARPQWRWCPHGRQPSRGPPRAPGRGARGMGHRQPEAAGQPPDREGEPVRGNAAASRWSSSCWRPASCSA